MAHLQSQKVRADLAKLSVTAIVCTHNCPPERLAAVVHALVNQDDISFDIVIIDNLSDPPVGKDIMAAHSRVRIVVEAELGLTPARLRGARESSSEVLAFVDDDNFVSSNYLRDGLAHFENPSTGVVGGRSRPLFQAPVPDWLKRKKYAPGCNDSGDAILTTNWRDTSATSRTYPSFAPIGTGMLVRRSVFDVYARALSCDPKRRLLDRRGKSLASGGDNDIVLTALGLGFDAIYDPSIEILHEIPAGRLSFEYVRRYAYETNLTWVQVLSYHGISPWKPIQPWTASLRKARAWFRMRPWQGPSEAIEWAGACGMIDGRAHIKRDTNFKV